ncbi:MAG: peptidylprolyl isomerase [Bacteroidales bacterium]|jgi:peptidyl-prolyl cis-trans isomerase B (cyclophilin B)|nr:peptidylprolyl isomerase [Bacteroidales bacterium]
MKKFLIIATITLFALSCANAEKRTQIQITVTIGNTAIFSDNTITPSLNDNTITLGDIVIELYNETPIHRDNFIKLVKENFYDDLLFHRCIRSFMIQGGDPNSRDAKPGQMLGSGDIGYTLPAEIKPNLVHTRGALAAARQGDQVNPEKRSSGCQFYIVEGQVFYREQIERMSANRHPKYTEEQIELYTTVGGTPHLDGAYTVFGHVVSGLDLVEKISLVPTDQNNRPLENVRMTSVKIIK